MTAHMLLILVKTRGHRPRLQLEHQTDRSAIRPRGHEMRSAERGVEVVQGDIVRQVADRESQCHMRPLLRLPEQIVHAEPRIEDVPGSDAGRIRIVILRSRRGYPHAFHAVIGTVALAGCERRAERRHVASASETDRQLFRSR